VWGIFTLFVGFAASYRQLLFLSLLSAVGLSAAANPLESLVSDLLPREKRGKAIGAIHALAYGGALGAVLAIGQLLRVSELGWRICFWVFGALSVLSGVLIWLFVDEPVRGQTEAALADIMDAVGDESEARYPFQIKKIPMLFKIPTLRLQWLQAMLFAVQSSTIFGFYVTWLADERGFSPSLATSSLAPLLVGAVLGNLLGGSVGDWADGRNPRHGRLLVGQLCMAGIALTTYLHTQIEWGSTAVFWALGFAQGLVGEMGATVALAPIRLAVTLPEIRATGSAVYGIVGKIFDTLTYLLIGKLALRLGLTTVFFWTLTVTCTVHTLLWFAFYPVYHKDAAKMQQVLAGRRAELTAGSESE
jgi:predicted MFS family arabinose efflux permease